MSDDFDERAKRVAEVNDPSVFNSSNSIGAIDDPLPYHPNPHQAGQEQTAQQRQQQTAAQQQQHWNEHTYQGAASAAGIMLPEQQQGHPPYAYGGMGQFPTSQPNAAPPNPSPFTAPMLKHSPPYDAQAQSVAGHVLPSNPPPIVTTHHIGVTTQFPPQQPMAAPPPANPSPYVAAPTLKQPPPYAVQPQAAAGHISPAATNHATLTNNYNNNCSPSTLLGRQIRLYYPKAKHFVVGCGSFHPLDNTEIREFIKQYFISRLQQDEAFRQETAVHLNVTPEMDAFLEQAALHFGCDVHYWDRFDTTGPKLKKTTWEGTALQDITANTSLLKSRMNEPLRNILSKLRSPGETNSRIARAPVSSVTMINQGPKKRRGTEVDRYVALPETATSMPPVPDEAASIKAKLDEIRAAVDVDISKLEDCKDLTYFKRQVEFGVVMPRLTRLTSAKKVAGSKFTEWAENWAKSLIPKVERDDPEAFSVEDHLEANQLDCDRKVCVEYLKILHRNFEDQGCVEIASKFKEYNLVAILSCTLEMDRAKARFFNFLHLSSRRGQHWYARNHIEPQDARWFVEEWQQYVQEQQYEGKPTISKHLMWYFDEEAFGLQEPMYAKLRELLEPKKAYWDGIEPVQIE